MPRNSQNAPVKCTEIQVKSRPKSRNKINIYEKNLFLKSLVLTYQRTQMKENLKNLGKAKMNTKCQRLRTGWPIDVCCEMSQ